MRLPVELQQRWHAPSRTHRPPANAGVARPGCASAPSRGLCSAAVTGKPATSEAAAHPGCAWRSSLVGVACACWAAAPAWTRRPPGRSLTPGQRSGRAGVAGPTAAVRVHWPTCHSAAQAKDGACATHALEEEVQLGVGVGVTRHLEQRREDVGQQLRRRGETAGHGWAGRARPPQLTPSRAGGWRVVSANKPGRRAAARLGRVELAPHAQAGLLPGLHGTPAQSSR